MSPFCPGMSAKWHLKCDLYHVRFNSAYFFIEKVCLALRERVIAWYRWFSSICSCSEWIDIYDCDVTFENAISVYRICRAYSFIENACLALITCDKLGTDCSRVLGLRLLQMFRKYIFWADRHYCGRWGRDICICGSVHIIILCKIDGWSQPVVSPVSRTHSLRCMQGSQTQVT